MVPIVDIHTHVYPPSYIQILRQRAASKSIPYIASFSDAPNNDRLIILPGEDDASTPSTARGRPVGPAYWDISQKIAFMDQHSIGISVISLANPWLDFLDPSIAAETATSINNEINSLCSQHPGRLFSFAALPLSATPQEIVGEIHRIAKLPYNRGVILGTSGLGSGLDDPNLDIIYAALEETSQLIFLHPHYGLPSSVYGPRSNEYGHVLPLALGFPLETTIAVTRMYLSGVFDRFPRLQVLLAHSGGTLPFLAGRIESCVQHDGHFINALKEGRRKSVWDVLKTNIYLDAVIYSEVGLKGAIGASGIDRVMFGTDHPFFPPLENPKEQWMSVQTNYKAIADAFATHKATANLVLGGNAIRVLRLWDHPGQKDEAANSELMKQCDPTQCDLAFRF